MVVVAALIFVGCFSKILIIILYNKLLEDSFKVADCNSELIKQIKLRYSNQIKLELPIRDAEKFVSRYIYQYSKIIKFASVLDMLSVILMLSGIAINYERQYFGPEVLFTAMFIYLAIGLLVNSDKKERIVINNISDYLVNNMNTRMTAREHRVQLKESMKTENAKQVLPDDDEANVRHGSGEMQERSSEIVKESAKETTNGFKKLLNGKNNEENAIIEEVLREFLQV